MAAPTDVAALGESAVAGGRVLEWIDKAAYACAVGWSGGYCVTAYVGNINFARPIHSGDVVEVQARLMHTGRSSMHVRGHGLLRRPAARRLRLGHLLHGHLRGRRRRTVDPSRCIHGRRSPMTTWSGMRSPRSQESVVGRDIEAGDGGADLHRRPAPPRRRRCASWPRRPTSTGAARPTAAPSCAGSTRPRTCVAAGWSAGTAIAAYSGGIRFYRPIQIGHIVEVQARLLHTGRSSMHISVHVRSGDPNTAEMQLTTHCLTIFVALDEQRQPIPVPRWEPLREEDHRAGPACPTPDGAAVSPHPTPGLKRPTQQGLPCTSIRHRHGHPTD